MCGSWQTRKKHCSKRTLSEVLALSGGNGERLKKMGVNQLLGWLYGRVIE
jgi:hypothetical protein